MRRRSPEAEEELERQRAQPAPEAGDLGALLLDAQDGAGNAALAAMMGRIEDGEAPATALLPGHDGGARDERAEERARQGAADRATYGALEGRILVARANPFSARVADDLRALERRLADAREYGWLGTDAAVLAGELDDVEDRLRRAADEEEAVHALAAVDLRRKPLATRVKKAITERVAITKPGMAIYAREDFEALVKLDARLSELGKRLSDNGMGVAAARGALGRLSDASTAYAGAAAA